eukprot:TRINITY_DN37583_c0_g1_i1.p1 TRINITY_DN37583_c0_g1~~TRINITY_DN37583_c0_g1_i1.p1  ORF type:complete len:256 (-),score=40.16 TRINITY_DN37583_c0_g1_i1:56-823(-)
MVLIGATLRRGHRHWRVLSVSLVLAMSTPRLAIGSDLDEEAEAKKKGFTVGTTGEFYRYKHIFNKGPTEADRNEAFQIASLIRCDVCVAIVESLVAKAKSISADDLADMLEGYETYAPTGDHVTDAMLSHKKGCNKHFKDELIAEGWELRMCKDVVPGRTDSAPCLHHGSSKPGAIQIDAYELWKEALFHACEQSVARHNDILATSLAKSLKDGGLNRSAVIRLACEEQARCAGGRSGGGGRKRGKGKTQSAGEL